jgi:hypothetical protein
MEHTAKLQHIAQNNNTQIPKVQVLLTTGIACAQQLALLLRLIQHQSKLVIIIIAHMYIIYFMEITNHFYYTTLSAINTAKLNINFLILPD